MRNIKLIVSNLVRRHNTRNPDILAKRINIHVIHRPLPENINGIYVNVKRYKAIIINESLNEVMRNIVIAHELGHHILHKNINQVFLIVKTHMKSNKYETQADKFVAELLLPDEYLRDFCSCLAFDELAVSEEMASYFCDLKSGK